jgi:uroporphyrinogen decarboxylase
VYEHNYRLRGIEETFSDMVDSAKLKREFGKDLSFWGGGADPVVVMSGGTAEDVQKEVRRRIQDSRTGGGYVFASIHNTQADVPPENVVAFFEAAYEYGSYG